MVLIVFQCSLFKIISHYKRLAITLMYCKRLHAWWPTQSQLTTLLSSLISRQWIGLQTPWRLQLWDLSIDEMVGAWCFGCCQALRGSPVGVLLFRYSVLFTVESFSLLYFLFISWFICSRRWYIDKLWFFMQTKHLCVLIHIWTKGEVSAPWKRFKPSSQIFLLTVPWPYFRVIYVLCLSCFLVCSLMPCGHLKAKGWPRFYSILLDISVLHLLVNTF